jgi:hypothetical protein
MTSVTVARVKDDDSRFSVDVRDDDGSVTTHVVSVSDDEWDRFGKSFETREELVDASFKFLLDREPTESVLRSFELGVLAHYFPDYPSALA